MGLDSSIWNCWAFSKNGCNRRKLIETLCCRLQKWIAGIITQTETDLWSGTWSWRSISPGVFCCWSMHCRVGLKCRTILLSWTAEDITLSHKPDWMAAALSLLICHCLEGNFVSGTETWIGQLHRWAGFAAKSGDFLQYCSCQKHCWVPEKGWAESPGKIVGVSESARGRWHWTASLTKSCSGRGHRSPARQG